MPSLVDTRPSPLRRDAYLLRKGNGRIGVSLLAASPNLLHEKAQLTLMRNSSIPSSLGGLAIAKNPGLSASRTLICTYWPGNL